ncbi:protease [Flaviaesturariibacter flavus]|uniref:Protease n=1 Tax=Flaviaesturariibacter flavus TaxID=2502780 RepID=A0A4R1B3C8_9BACT|nr:M57 family metalloprotease [Flaviaesturariibacter flavus]TCJ12592.1 protease [Flaviaesturariibacter flavus]
MKRISTPILLAALASVSLFSCKKQSKEDVSAINTETLNQIQRLGFSTDGVQRTANGYLVEGDILLRESDLGANPTSPNMVIAQEEQYRTFNLVSATKHPTIKIALNNSSAAHEAAFSAALDEAVRRYNAEGLTINFQRVTTGADITIVAFYEVSNTLGSSGFPNATGDPYNEVKMNTYWYNTGTDATNTNYIATIISHEVGHCIGYRHTDYFNRAYSCGGRKSNEGQATTGVGAVQIPGTPSGADPNSWMLACIGSNVNRPFNANDKIALSYVY